MSRKFGVSVLREVMARDHSLPEPEIVESEAEEIEIQTVFARRLAGLRRLPKRERPHALKAARDWRQQALQALRERRALDRHQRRVRLQLAMQRREPISV
jgi:hypothetical protein